MVDIEKLQKAVSNFAYYSRPSSSDGSSPATVRDINNLIEQTTTVLNQFIDELGKQR